MRPVKGGRQKVDLGLEDVDALEHAGGAAFQVLLQHAAIDELDLPALHDFDTTRAAQVYESSAIDDLQEIQIEERIVEVLAQILEAEDRLVGDEPRLVKVVALERERQGLFEDKIPDESHLRGEVRLCRFNRHEVAPLGVGDCTPPVRRMATAARRRAATLQTTPNQIVSPYLPVLRRSVTTFPLQAPREICATSLK